MKRMIFSFSFLLYVAGAYAQITLEECQRKTQDNYPLVHQYGLVEKTKEYNLENAAKGYLPQFALSAKASYQSDVTEIPVKLPGVDLKGLSKDQYQVMLELQQKIWDGGGIRMQKKQTIAEAEVEKEKLAAVAKNMGIAKDRFEFFLEYKDAKTFDFRKTQWSSKYSYILVGPMPHSGVAKGEYSSIISAIESEAGYPPVVKMGTDGLKITKTSFRKTLKYLLTEKKIA